MAIDVITLALVRKLISESGTAFSDISVSADGTSIVFTSIDGSTTNLSVSDWNSLTDYEKQKITKIIINGSGNKFLADDGTYKEIVQKNPNYEDSTNKPSINGVELIKNKTAEELGFATVAMTGKYSDLIDLPIIPVMLSQLTNDMGFVTNTVDNLINYYLKAETYTKTEVNSLISNIASLDMKIVTTLPTSNISITTIYLIEQDTTNFYTQWMYINNSWANIGSTEINLENYYTKAQVNSLLDSKVDKVSGYGLSQRDYTPEEKAKLAGLTNYELPIASEVTLGGVKVDGVTIIVDENGVISTAGGGSGLAPGNVKNLRIVEENQALVLYWEDPDDIVIEGHVFSAWKGTRVIYKIGEYPKTPTDGTLIVDNTIRNSYATDGYRLTGLANGIVYYFQLFPYSSTNAINSSNANQISGTPSYEEKIMTVAIDLANSNPLTALTYLDDALSMTPGSDEWDSWFGIYPCLFKDGMEVGRLDPNDYSKFLDGSPADIYSGDAGDVMVAFPRKGLKIETVGTTMTISMTNSPNNPNYAYNAHMRGTVNKDIFYLSAYRVSTTGYSISGVLPASSITFNDFRTLIRGFGIGYDVGAFFQLVFRQSMYILKYKDLNSQKVAGYGSSTNMVNGSTDQSGMNFPGITPTDGKSKMKLFGLEDFWGGRSEFIDGCKTDSSGKLLTATENFNNAGTGYKVGQTLPYMTGIGFISKVSGSTEGGFIPTAISGSATTYFCDFGMRTNGAMCFYGGFYQTLVNNGIFCQLFNNNGEAGSIGARKMYL